jgi:D-3-phosphoglycerate dehydrogenase
MQVIVYDPNCSMEQCYCAERLDIEMVELDELYERADFICLHTILCDETRHLINTDSISRMKPGVRIINTARGALILEEDLAEAIKSGHVAGAALDVYSKEPPPKDHPLVGLPGVVHTPHLAASTKSAQIEVAVQAAEQVVYALKDGEYCNVKNPEVLEAEVVLEPV